MLRKSRRTHRRHERLTGSGRRSHPVFLVDAVGHSRSAARSGHVRSGWDGCACLAARQGA